MRIINTLFLVLMFVFPAIQGMYAGEEVFFQDNFDNKDNWDWFYKKGDKGYTAEGNSRLGSGIDVKSNCFVLSTSSSGATLKKAVPKNIIVETKLKVSIIKDRADTPDPDCPGANIYLRKTEKNNIWHSYVVRFWFLKDGNGIILIRRYDLNFAEGPYIPEKSLLEKKWYLALDTWYDVRVLVMDNNITLWINGEEIGTASDPDGLCSEGAVALSGHSWPSWAFFKDFKILKAE